MSEVIVGRYQFVVQILVHAISSVVEVNGWGSKDMLGERVRLLEVARVRIPVSGEGPTVGGLGPLVAILLRGVLAALEP